MKSLDQYWNSLNLVSVLLLPLSGIFCLLAKFRKFLFDTGFLHRYQSPVPVVIVGNISVGGTGKTPLLIALVQQLQQAGVKPGVISRGYGGQSTVWPQRVVSTSTAEQVGDEPVLIFQRTGCPIVVGPDRKQDIELLLKSYACDLILSDDGMQHYALQRDKEIAVVDVSRQFGNGFCLPSGPLREPVNRLLTVDLVLINGGAKEENAFNLKNSNCYAVSDLLDESCALATFSGHKVHAVAGIGNPQRFFDMLIEQGIDVIPHVFADHYRYDIDDVQFNDNYPVLMTEKDAVKCHSFDLHNHWAVRVDAVLTDTAQKNINQLFKELQTQV